MKKKQGPPDIEENENPDYTYILNMPIWNFTKEGKEDLQRQSQSQQAELDAVKTKAPKDNWKIDLSESIKKLDVSLLFTVATVRQAM